MPDMPEVDHGGYIMDLINEVGLVVRGSEGMSPMTWTEVRSWCEMTGVELNPFESSTIIKLSRDYVSAYHSARDKAFPSPWRSEDVDPEKLSQGIERAFRRMAKSQQKRGVKRGRRQHPV